MGRVSRGGWGPPAVPAPVPVTGLEWDGNEETNTQRVLRWLSPFPIYDATYIFRVYPKGPKTGSNPHYWTTFFWGNYGDFGWGSAGTFYGAHPYPFHTPPTAANQEWEISVHFSDTEGPSVTWNRWYTQVFRAWRESASITHHEFIYDWDLFVSSSGASGYFTQSINDSGWAASNPPTPSIVVGEAPPNDANTASWGGYTGREQFKGIILGLQFYDALIGTSSGTPTIANTANVASELASPGSTRAPWYLNLNPTPSDVTDKSGNGHHPSFPASLPSLWTG
jgi:hypothetical protein